MSARDALPVSGDRLSVFVRGVIERSGLDRAALAGVLRTLEQRTDSGDHSEASAMLRAGVDAALAGGRLSPQERFQVESIILPNGLRPAIDIVNGSFGVIQGLWSVLNTTRQTLLPMVKGIGTLILSGHPTVTQVGTAFVVAQNTILTNFHVASTFLNIRPGVAPSLVPGIAARLELRQEIGSPISAAYPVVASRAVVPEWDAVLLEVPGLPPDAMPLPLAGTPPAPAPQLRARAAVVVGYPMRDEESDLVQQIKLFRGAFGKKRLMPGCLVDVVQAAPGVRPPVALRHDCSTLGGCSGAPLIDLASGVVVGLHFFGRYLDANYAVPTWELARVPALAQAGLAFV